MNEPKVVFDRRVRDVPVAVERRKRGRPRKERTIRFQLRIPISVYDRYCRIAIRMGRGREVNSIIRRIVEFHAPPEEP